MFGFVCNEMKRMNELFIMYIIALSNLNSLINEYQSFVHFLVV